MFLIQGKHQYALVQIEKMKTNIATEKGILHLRSIMASDFVKDTPPEQRTRKCEV